MTSVGSAGRAGAGVAAAGVLLEHAVDHCPLVDDRLVPVEGVQAGYREAISSAEWFTVISARWISSSMLPQSHAIA